MVIDDTAFVVGEGKDSTVRETLDKERGADIDRKKEKEVFTDLKQEVAKTGLITDDDWERKLAKITGIKLKEELLGTKDFNQTKLSIHQKSAVNFYKEVLKASSEVINILSKGLSFKFKRQPTEYMEANNKSAFDMRVLLPKR